MSSTDGTMVMGIVGVKVVGGLACVTLSWNVWTQVAGSWRNGDGRGYDLWGMKMIIHACS